MGMENVLEKEKEASENSREHHCASLQSTMLAELSSLPFERAVVRS
jgi:hypothetical protein